jgi:hypothetical protein
VNLHTKIYLDTSLFYKTKISYIYKHLIFTKLKCVSFLATLRRQRRRPRFRCATPPARLHRPGPTPAPPSSSASAHRPVTILDGAARRMGRRPILDAQIPRAR